MPIIITVRDPLDCIVSLSERFHDSFEHAASIIVSSAELMVVLTDICEPLVVKYEGEPRDAAAVARIARHIGAAADEAQAAAIAEKLSAKAVAAFIDGLVAEGYFGPEPSVGQFHGETHWHPHHLGSGESGRHAHVLSTEQIATVDDATQVFRRRFGYLRAGET